MTILITALFCLLMIFISIIVSILIITDAWVFSKRKKLEILQTLEYSQYALNLAKKHRRHVHYTAGKIHIEANAS